MNTPEVKKIRKKPVVLTKGFEDILRAVNVYRYMTALDVAHLLFSPSALVRVRSRLTELSGGDFVDGEYLYRLRLASIPRGNPERIYTLGAKGRDFLQNVLGVPVGWKRQQYTVSSTTLWHSYISIRVSDKHTLSERARGRRAWLGRQSISL